MGNGIPEITIRPQKPEEPEVQTRRESGIQTSLDFDELESLVLFNKLTDPNYTLKAQEQFDAVNFIAEEYTPITKNNVTAKKPQVGTTFTDLAGANQIARATGATNPRIENSYLGLLLKNKPRQVSGEEPFDIFTFQGLVDRGFITTKDGTPINIQFGPGEARRAQRNNQYNPYYATYQEYLNNPQNFKTENLLQKYELLKSKELSAYELGDKFDIETPLSAGLGFGPKLKPNVIQFDERGFFDFNNSIQYYMFTKDDAASEVTFVKDQQGNDIPQYSITSTQQDYFNKMQYFDPDSYNSYMKSLETPLYAKQILEEGTVNLGGTMAPKTAEELGIEGAPEGAVFVPITKELGAAEEAYVRELENIVADVNTSYGFSQALGALALETIPGVGLLGGTFSAAGRAIKSGVGVIRGTAGRLAKFNLPKSVDLKKIEVDINGDFTPETVTYLKGQKIGNDILDRMQGDFRRDVFALKIRSQNDSGLFMSKTDDFSGIPPIPKDSKFTTKVPGEDYFATYLSRIDKSKPGPFIRADGTVARTGNIGPISKEDKRILDLYKKIMNGEIEVPRNFVGIGPNSKLIELGGIENLANANDAATVGVYRTLQKFDDYLIKKGNRLSEPEAIAKIEQKFPGMLDDILSVKGQLRADQATNIVEQELYRILKPEQIELIGTGLKTVGDPSQAIALRASVFKNITEQQLNNLGKVYNRYLNGKLMRIETASDVALLTRNSKIKKILNDGKVPTLDDLNEVLYEGYQKGQRGLTDRQATTRLNRILDYMLGEDIILPLKYDQLDPFTASFPRNKELANEIITELNKLASASPWKSYYGYAERGVYISQADRKLLRPNGNRNSILQRLVGTQKGESVHEFAGIRTSGKNNLDSYGNFVTTIDSRVNELLGTIQGQLGLKNTSWLNKNISLDEYINAHNKIVRESTIPVGNKDVKAAPFLAEIMKPSGVTKYYTKEELKLFKEKYGMDLVKEAKEAGYAYKIPRNADGGFTLLDDLAPKGMAMGGTPISREKFQTPGLGGQSEEERFLASQMAAGVPAPGSIEFSVDQATKNVQQDIQNMYAMNLRESTDRAIETILLRQEDIQATLADKLNPPRPVKFKFSELPRLVTQSPLAQIATTDPRVAGLETIEFIYNSLRRGVENDIEMEEKFPKIYKMNELTKVKGPGSTPEGLDEQDYISAIDEFNRAADTGLTNFAYNVLDLVFSIPDAVLPTEFTEELKRRYEESDMAKPETFVGQIASVALEFGIPGGIVFKLVNRFRKAVQVRSKGKVNLFAQKTYALEGLPKLGVQISNVAKRVGTGMVSFGAADFIAGGPYNTLAEMFDDPLLSSKLVGEYQDTSELSGKERVAANFKNRLRFGAEGAMIGGLFPLVGPALGAIGKNVLLKPTLFVGGGLLKTANVLAIKPATYLASKDPIVLPGLARGVGVFGEFLGKDVLARLAATAATGGRALIPSLKGNMGQLPEFSKWRMFDVTSNDPLEAGLKRVDNFLKWFREAGNQTLYAFNLSGGAERFIKSKAREIEKYIDGIEKKAYDLANGFLGRYNKGFTSPAGERHMLEQVYEYLRGNLKLTKIEPELRELAKALKDEFDQIRKAYFRELPEGSGMRAALESNLDKYMRMSFATFTNPNYIPNQAVINDAVSFMTEIITKNEDFVEAAVKGVPVTEQAAAIREFARANVDNIIAIGKREGVDPLNALNQINREILRGDDVLLQTGEELPAVIRKLLGQEKNLRASVMSTTGSLVSQTANIKAFKEFARHGLENGYLFTSRAQALAAGVTDPGQIRNLPGLGQMQDLATVDKDGPIGLFASNELKRTVENTGGMLDSLLQNSFYQSLIAYKAAVQTGKTVFSPATQTRNFGSAGFFPMHVGHIGGGASVTDAFKIVMDDIFGAGRTVNEVDLIKRIQRKVELGVLDENIVASELGAILKDIKAGKLQSIGKLAERAENTKFYKTATRVYAGGDNVWKWYGHEYYMSQLKGAFKDINGVKRFFEDIHGIEYNVNNIMTGARKTLDEGIEEAAAFLLRETYPTYSKVPEFIKAIRKLPIGNFVSFTSEILRTGFSTSAVAMKHIASDNQVLREMGYRMLSGQAITLGGMTAGVTALGHALTNVTPIQVDVYKEYFAPEYMKYSTLIPVSNVENGTFKVFDFSRYNPYDIIVASSKQLLKVADRRNYSKELAQLKEQHAQLDPDSEEARELRRRMKEIKIRLSFGQTLDPEKIQTDTLRQYLSYVGPLYDSVTGTFFGIPIGAEAFLEAASGRTRQGSPIWSKGMTDTEIFDRSMAHFFKTIEPGIISSGRKLFYSLRGDVSGVGQPLEVDTEIFKLMGGSNVTVDIMGSLDFKISAFQQSFREAKVAKDFFSTENFQSRGPEQLVREYNEQNEQAFRAQYEFYQAAMAAIDSGLLTRTEILKALAKRLAPGSDGIPTKAIMLMNGFYTPLSYGPEGLKSRREKILRNVKDLDQRKYNYQYFFPLGMLEAAKMKWKGIRFEDMEKELEQPDEQSAAPVETPQVAPVEEPQVAELPTTPAPIVQAQVPNVNPQTGLTTTETALLSPGEQAIRLRQKQGTA